MIRAIFITLFSFGSLFSAELISVDQKHPLFSEVEKLFEKVIAPIYGDQTSALRKISEGRDRRLELLLDQESIAGVLVYKTKPTEEFTPFHLPSALTIKTLFVVEGFSNKGFGTKLIERIEKIAKENPFFKSIVVTVSEEKPESLNFFQKKGFSIVQIMPDKYKPGIKEYRLGKAL